MPLPMPCRANGGAWRLICDNVIASEAIQSAELDCFVALLLAMTMK